MDNLPAHKVGGVREMFEASGARLLYLPSYSPDFKPDRAGQAQGLPPQGGRPNPRRAPSRHRRRLDAFAHDECANYFTAPGYESE